MNSINCSICDKTYTRKGDPKRHVLKEHPTPQTPAPVAIPVADWDIPQSFYDLLDDLVSSELDVTDPSQPSLNKATQTIGTKVTSCETKHSSINTEPKETADKGTNTDPLIY